MAIVFEGPQSHLKTFAAPRDDLLSVSEVRDKIFSFAVKGKKHQ